MEMSRTPLKEAYILKKRNKILFLVITLAVLLIVSFFSLFVGSSNLSFSETWAGLVKTGTSAQIRIVWNIRIPRILAAFIAGAGLSVAGLIMQTVLGNSMASPSTLGVSNAATFGANVSIIGFAGGFLSTGNNINAYSTGSNPYATSAMAFLFAAASVLVILGLCSLRSFSPNTVVLAGIAIGSICTSATTILQYYATDVGLSAAVVWSFGDLSRATYTNDWIMLAVVGVSSIFFMLMSWKYNALLSGDGVAKSVGVNVSIVRFASLLIASLVTAVCVSFLGIIGFVGIICPHVVKRVLGEDHRFSVPASILSGSLLLVLADTLARTIGNGSSLPVGAITSLLGAPFFLFMIFTHKEGKRC